MSNYKVLIYGNFNIIHAGHLRLINYAKEIGSEIIIGVFANSFVKNEKLIDEKTRLNALKKVDGIRKIILVKNLSQTLRDIKPDFVLKGIEHKDKENPEINIINQIGAKLIFGHSSNTYNYSISDKFKKNLDAMMSVSLPADYMKRHKISNHDLIRSIKSLKKKKVCVIGDLILDNYIYSHPIGMSQETPTIVVSPEKEEIFIGGAGIVAAHAASLSKKTFFFSVLPPKDQNLSFIKNKLSKYKIDYKFFYQAENKVNFKTKYYVENNCLFKVSKLNKSNMSSITEKKIINSFKKISSDLDLVIFSDFNYGAISKNLIESIKDICNRKNIVISADNQSSSQIGDITKYKSLDLITPTEFEARTALNNSYDGIVELCNKLLKVSKVKELVIKLNRDGVIIHKSHIDSNQNILTDKIPALNSNPVDTSGAGDSLLVGSSLALASGINIWQSSLIGSILAAIQVSRMGNIPIKFEEINDLLSF